MNPIKKTIHFTIEADGDMQTAITEELILDWARGEWWTVSSNPSQYAWQGRGFSQTAAILDWLAVRLGVK